MDIPCSTSGTDQGGALAAGQHVVDLRAGWNHHHHFDRPDFGDRWISMAATQPLRSADVIRLELG
jgi:hypothetical protein